MSLKYTALRAGFEALWLSRLPGLIRHFSASRGVIFTLHRVLPDVPPAFSPNAILQIRPDFLDCAIERVRDLGLDIVTLDEALERLVAPEPGRRFAVLTFDDGYRDILQFALPVLRRQRAPFVLYVPTAYPDGVGQLWWQAIEDIIARQKAIALTVDGERDYVDTLTVAQKQAVFDIIYWQMRKMPEAERLNLLERFTWAHGYDMKAQCRDLIMNWQEIRLLADEPLCTIGAHTVHHYELSKLPPEQASDEILRSADILEMQLGRRPAHFAYPLGGPRSAGEREFGLVRNAGFRSAVTTRPGGLYSHHATTPYALPRISLNGLFQARRYVDVFATGAIFTLIEKLMGRGTIMRLVSPSSG